MKKIAILPAILLVALNLFAQKTYIWCGTLIDAVSNDAKKNMTIVVEKNKITAVEAGYSNPGANDKTIDLKTKTVTPGWIDCHVHLSHQGNSKSYLEEFQLNDVDYAYRSVVFAKKNPDDRLYHSKGCRR